MFYPENYWIYKDLITTKKISINTDDINKGNWGLHFQSILNIMLDAIETPLVKEIKINVVFGKPEINCNFVIVDYWYNLIMWSTLVSSNQEIKPNNIFFNKTFKAIDIKRFLDKYYIDTNRRKINSIELNNGIDDCLDYFNHIDDFSYFLANTVNLDDFATLMLTNKEFDDLVHSDLSNVPMADVKNEGMRRAERSIEIIKENNHCLSNFFKAGEGVSPKQYKEVAINIGTKPDGRGGAYPVIVNTNFITGGVDDYVSYLLESSTGRIAQIIVDGSVGDSGYFARLLGLDVTDVYLNPNRDYCCDTKNFEVITLTEDRLSLLKNRYYRDNPNGIDKLIDTDDVSLIGKTIYLRSPMTCASLARGEGICYKCYGDLAYSNNDVSTVGRMSSEIVSSGFTQKMLSAKHILESAIKDLIWNKEFESIFRVEYNILKLEEDVPLKGYTLIIDPEKIEAENEEAEDLDYSYNEYIKSFDVEFPNGQIVTFHTEDYDNIYLTPEITEEIKSLSDKTLSDTVYIDLADIKYDDVPLFAMKIQNNDIVNSLKKVKSIFESTPFCKETNKDDMLMILLDTIVESKMRVQSVHLETLLSAQIRSVENILEYPSWEYANEPYIILPLKQSLEKHPSITVSLLFESISKLLYSPITFLKRKASRMDLFFMEQPQMYLSKNVELQETKYDPEESASVMHDPISFDKEKLLKESSIIDDTEDGDDTDSNNEE